MRLSDLAEVVAEWAINAPNVRAAYLFGSRVKGTHCGTSDLDVAVELVGEDEGFVNWMHDASDMRSSLSALLSVPLDLQMMHSADEIVKPAVLEHGLLVYERTES